jgi:hypothetical protein
MFATVALYTLVVIALISAVAFVLGIIARVASAIVESRVKWRLFQLFGQPYTSFYEVNDTLEKCIVLALIAGIPSVMGALALHQHLLP